jgi:hypothetical protein
MKIEIETNVLPGTCDLTIDGRRFQIVRHGPRVTITTPVDGRTLGGAVAAFLYPYLDDIRKLEEEVRDDLGASTWKRLSEAEADEFLEDALV